MAPRVNLGWSPELTPVVLTLNIHSVSLNLLTIDRLLVITIFPGGNQSGTISMLIEDHPFSINVMVRPTIRLGSRFRQIVLREDIGSRNVHKRYEKQAKTSHR